MLHHRTLLIRAIKTWNSLQQRYDRTENTTAPSWLQSVQRNFWKSGYPLTRILDQTMGKHCMECTCYRRGDSGFTEWCHYDFNKCWMDRIMILAFRVFQDSEMMARSIRLYNFYFQMYQEQKPWDKRKRSHDLNDLCDLIKWRKLWGQLKNDPLPLER